LRDIKIIGNILSQKSKIYEQLNNIKKINIRWHFSNEMQPIKKEKKLVEI
jgi:hypothetical protein